MKLSEKGKRKILDNPYWFMNPFYPEDFEGAVVLPIDEAKVIFEALLRLPVEGNKAVLKKVLIPLKEKIEQAEIKHLKDEISQWKEEQERDNYYRYQFLKSKKQVEAQNETK